MANEDVTDSHSDTPSVSDSSETASGVLELDSRQEKHAERRDRDTETND